MEDSETSRSLKKEAINIVGNVVNHWVKIGTDEGLTTDTQIATFLIRHYCTSQLGTRLSAQCDHCHEPLILVCASCGHPSHANSTLETKTCDVPVINEASQKAFMSQEDGPRSLPPASNLKNELQFAHSDDGPEYNHLKDKQTSRASLDVPSEMDDSHSNPERFQVHQKELTQASRAGKSTDTFTTNRNSKLKEEDPDYVLPVSFGESQQGVDNKNVQVKAETAAEASVLEENRHELDGVQPALSYSAQPKEQAARSVTYKLRNAGQAQSNDRPHSCTKCDATFKWRHHLRGHLHKVHAVTDFFPCKFCHKNFSTFSNLKRHHKTHKDLTAHSCALCDASFQQAYQLKLHTQTHTGEKPFVCSVCSSAFSRKYKLTYHMRCHTGEKPFSCEECGSTFARSQYLAEHMRTHTGEKPYVCKECGAAFAQYTTMKIHFGTHSADKPYACDVCGKAYKTSFSLHRHTKVHHDSKDKQQDPVQNQEEPSVCEECGKTFPDSRNLKRHMKAHQHQQEESFVCKECGKAFSKAVFLKRHTQIHSGEKPFMCTVCGISFRHAFRLSNHMRTHTGERPFKCSYGNCGAAFKGTNELRHHERIHTQYKPHVCQFCSAAFAQGGNLRMHLRMHTDERPYVCEICGKSFRRSNQLKNHNLMHRDERPHVCKVCGAAFRRDYTLKFHLQKKHADLNTSDKPKQE